MKLDQFFSAYNILTNQTAEAQIQPLFATPLYKAQYNGSLQNINQYLQNIEFGVAEKSFNMQSRNNYLLNEEVFAELKKFIELHIDNYCAEVLKTSTKLRITQSWGNATMLGKHHHPHTHPNSIVSGVFFSSVNDNHPPIEFLHANSSSFNLEKIDQLNESIYSDTIYKHTGINGELLLFPSTLMHHVSTNMTDVPRVSLSFNTFAVGSLGQEISLTYLDLPRGNNV
jgi:uncharacterized protein (TIGR02466 family)